MLTEFFRDQVFSVAWLGLMAFVWFGWGQEYQANRVRTVLLGVGSALGLGLAALFGYLVFVHWNEASALEGQYEVFGFLVAAEFLLAGAGSGYLVYRRKARWIAWWVALVVGAHFIPLAFLLQDGSLALLGVLQVGALAFVVPRVRAHGDTSSREVGPLMGLSLLLFATASALLALVRI